MMEPVSDSIGYLRRELAKRDDKIRYLESHIKRLERNMILDIDYEKPELIEPYVKQAVKICYSYFEDWMLTAQTRKMEVTFPRQLYMSLMREFTNLSHKKIGFMCGGRDHSTVIHACKSVEDMRITQRRFAAQYDDAIQFLKGKRRDIRIENALTP